MADQVTIEIGLEVDEPEVYALGAGRLLISETIHYVWDGERQGSDTFIIEAEE